MLDIHNFNVWIFLQGVLSTTVFGVLVWPQNPAPSLLLLCQFATEDDTFNPPPRSLERQLSMSEVCLRVRLPKQESGMQAPGYLSGWYMLR